MKPNTSQAPTKHLDLAERMEDVATLIGEYQEKEVTFSTGHNVIPGLGCHAEAKRLLENADRLREDTLLVGVIGDVSVGKTTLVNAMLDTDLPVSPFVKSGVLTHIVHGQNTDTATVSYADNTPPQTMSLEAFNDFSALDSSSLRERGDLFPLPERLVKVHHAVVESASPLSAKGITFVDTLGYNAGPTAEAAANKLVQRADAIIIVVCPPFKQTDAEFFKSQFKGDPKTHNILFVVNDFGLRDDEKAEVLPGLRILLSGIVEDVDTQMFFVNAREALEAKRDGAAGEALEATGIPAFECALQQSLNKKRHQLVREAAVAKRVAPAYATAKNTLADQKSESAAALKTLEAALHDANDKQESSRKKAQSLVSSLTKLGETTAEKAATNFHNYFNRMDAAAWRARWKKVSPNMKWLEFTNTQALQAKLKAPLAQLINDVMTEWAEQFLAALKDDADFRTLQAALEKAAEDITYALATSLGRLNVALQKSRFAKDVVCVEWVPLIVTIGAGTGTAIFRENKLAVVICTVLALVAIARIIVKLPTNAAEKLSNRVADRVADEVQKMFVEKSLEIQNKIKANIADEFKQEVGRIEKSLAQKIADGKTQLDHLHKQKRQDTTEQARLEAIDACLTAQWEAISELVYR